MSDTLLLSNYKLHIIVEDDGLKYFLDQTLPLTSLPADLVNVVHGHGWTNLFKVYNDLIEKSINPKSIAPVIDGDTIAENKPRANHEVLDNPNLIRLYRDLEFAFDNWMIAEAMIQLNCSPFGVDNNPQNFLDCEKIVNAARQVSSKHRIGLHEVLQDHCKDAHVLRGHDRSSFVLPGKVAFAKAIAEIVVRTGIFPEQLQWLVQHFERVATNNGVDLKNQEKLRFPNLNLREIQGVGLSGKILISHYPSLWMLDFNRNSYYRFNSNLSREIRRASWSPDGNYIACEAQINPPGKGMAVLIMNETCTEEKWVTRRISMGFESNPCWFRDGKSILIRTENGLCRATLDSRNWPEVLTTETGTTSDQCVSLNGRIAVNVYDRPTGRYFLQVGAPDAKTPYDKVPNITDTRSGVSWSSTGRYVAFINHVNQERGSVYHTHFTKTPVKPEDGMQGRSEAGINRVESKHV